MLSLLPFVHRRLRWDSNGIVDQTGLFGNKDQMLPLHHYFGSFSSQQFVFIFLETLDSLPSSGCALLMNPRIHLGLELYSRLDVVNRHGFTIEGVDWIVQ